MKKIIKYITLTVMSAILIFSSVPGANAATTKYKETTKQELPSIYELLDINIDIKAVWKASIEELIRNAGENVGEVDKFEENLPTIEDTQPTIPEETEPVVEDTKPVEPEVEETVPETKPTEPVETKPAHTHKYNSKTTKPDCDSDGYTTYSCDCRDTYKDDYKKVLGHDYKKTVVEPTTENKGYTQYDCSRCGKSYKDNYKDKLPTYKEVDETVYVTGASSLNVRKGPGTSYDKIGTLSEGASIKRVGIGDNGWSKIIYDGKEAYVSSNYLTTKKPAEKVNVGSYNSIKHNYGALTSAEIDIVNQILGYTNQCINNPDGERIDILVEGTYSYESICRINSFFMLEFADARDGDDFVSVGIVNRDGKQYLLYQVFPSDLAKLAKQKQNMDAKIDSIISTFHKGSEEEMLNQCADWLRNNMDYARDYNVGAESIFSGKANCDGFAQMFMKMAMRLGIKCDWCVGIASNGEGHAWNRVTFSNGRKAYYDACLYNSNGKTKYLNSSSCWHTLQNVNAIY